MSSYLEKAVKRAKKKMDLEKQEDAVSQSLKDSMGGTSKPSTMMDSVGKFFKEQFSGPSFADSVNTSYANSVKRSDEEARYDNAKECVRKLKKKKKK